MLAPIRPSPTIPSCIGVSVAIPLLPRAACSQRIASGPHRAVPADQRVRGAVVGELGLGLALELRHDPLRERLAELDAPLVEGVDAPDGALREDAVLVER